MSSVRSTAVALALCALAAAGCGFGPGEDAGTVQLTVTRDYGREEVVAASEEVSESDTVLRVLDRETEIETRYGGGFVQSIDGIEGGSEGGRRFDWFFYVNGIESPLGSAELDVAGGDRIWWDHRDWSSAMRVPAVVGDFPQPFLDGFRGERWEAEVVCRAAAGVCQDVSQELEDAGVVAPTVGALGEADPDAIRVLVGPYGKLRGDRDAVLLEGPPSESGVFARFDQAGGQLALLDQRGQAVRAGPMGLVAAVRPGDGPPTWLVTGTDPSNVSGAAAIFGEQLKGFFAAAVDTGQAPLRLPLEAGG